MVPSARAAFVSWCFVSRMICVALLVPLQHYPYIPGGHEATSQIESLTASERSGPVPSALLASNRVGYCMPSHLMIQPTISPPLPHEFPKDWDYRLPRSPFCLFRLVKA